MGRTLPSATMVFHEEEQYFAPFRKALSPTDRVILDQLFDYAQRHIAEAAYAAHPMPMMIFIVSMLLEQHKEIMRLRAAVERLKNPLYSRAAEAADAKMADAETDAKMAGK